MKIAFMGIRGIPASYSGFETFVEQSWRTEAILTAPELILAEAGQVLVKKEKAGYIKKSQVQEILSLILELPIELVGHRELIDKATTIARQKQTTVYDALFCTLALKRNGKLFTADDELRAVFEKISVTPDSV